MNTEKDYIKAFNTGYILGKYERVLCRKCLKYFIAENFYIQALLEGRKEFEKENNKSILEDLNTIRSKNESKEIERDE